MPGAVLCWENRMLGGGEGLFLLHTIVLLLMPSHAPENQIFNYPIHGRSMVELGTLHHAGFCFLQGGCYQVIVDLWGLCPAMVCHCLSVHNDPGIPL